MYTNAQAFDNLYILRGKNKYSGNPFTICLPISDFLYKCEIVECTESLWGVSYQISFQ